MLRLFFALQPTEVQGASLVASVSPFVKEIGGQDVPAANLHATLCFVGAVSEEKLPELRAAAATVRASRVELSFDALDYWETPGILCATAEESAAARDLSVAIDAAVRAAGFVPDTHPFRAHLTLARKVRKSVAKEHSWPRALEKLRMRCDEFVLMSSRREEGRSMYSAVGSWPLYADESR